MMSNEPDWFAPKRYGFGASLPLRWQGWLLTIAYLLLVGASAVLLRRSHVACFAIVAILTTIFIIICARTTRGGWRWRWGDDH